MRAQGYRPIQMWVPDVRSERFAAEARRQAALVAAAEDNDEGQEFIEAVSVAWDDNE